MIPVLYSFRRCPYAMRARMAISYAHVAVELREVSLKDKPDSLLRYSSKGTVPVLVVNKMVMDESLEIMQWALFQRDEQGWLDGYEAVDSNKIHSLIIQSDEGFKPLLDRYKYSDRYSESEDYYWQLCMPFLDKLNNLIGEKQYLFSDKVSIADIAIFPFIRQFAFVNKLRFDGMPYIHLVKWMNNLLVSDYFVTVMDKYSPWKEGDYILYQPFRTQTS